MSQARSIVMEYLSHVCQHPGVVPRTARRVYETRETQLSKQISLSWKFQKESGRNTQPLFNGTVTGDLSGLQRDVDIDR